MSRETLNFSMYSDISSCTRASFSPKTSSARALARCVFPTPVGPRKMKEPMGRFGSLRSARERRRALASAWTASCWPMTRDCRVSPILSSLERSPSPMRVRGMPVHFEMTCFTSSSPTSTMISSRFFRQAFRSASSFAEASFSRSRRAAAFSKS